MVTGGFDELGTDGTTERGQGTAQGAARALRVAARPQQVSQRITGAGSVCECEVGEQSDGLAGLEGDQFAVRSTRGGPNRLTLITRAIRSTTVMSPVVQWDRNDSCTVGCDFGVERFAGREVAS